MASNWVACAKMTILILLIAAIIFVCFTLPVKKILKEFLVWVEHDLGSWGPLALAVAYIPLTLLAVPAAVLSLGGGYLFGLPVGFCADSVGATAGASVSFLLGRTIAKSFVISKSKDYPQFQAVSLAIEKSGFKIVLLLRLVPFFPFGMMNYLLSVTPVPLGQYMVSSWLGMMPMTLALVYIGTTLKDISDVTDGESSKNSWAFLVFGLVVSVVITMCVTKVAKSALDKALAESNMDCEASEEESSKSGSQVSLQQPILVKVDSSVDFFVDSSVDSSRGET
ncbi:SNARE associated Golgi protein family [Heracleum sosnowskyi]|uniref:SNARE associated Golgi protein family n=1 Tax=Heracleum sosnowskyi TaxID=360622 RepID=A0AAD8I7X3_9APIA|nr:SNARE associated Golgi protein family [Heracleum sosnowskyi]